MSATLLGSTLRSVKASGFIITAPGARELNSAMKVNHVILWHLANPNGTLFTHFQKQVKVALSEAT